MTSLSILAGVCAVAPTINEAAVWRYCEELGSVATQSKGRPLSGNASASYDKLVRSWPSSNERDRATLALKIQLGSYFIRNWGAPEKASLRAPDEVSSWVTTNLQTSKPIVVLSRWLGDSSYYWPSTSWGPDQMRALLPMGSLESGYWLPALASIYYVSKNNDAQAAEGRVLYERCATRWSENGLMAGRFGAYLHYVYLRVPSRQTKEEAIKWFGRGIELGAGKRLNATWKAICSDPATHFDVLAEKMRKAKKGG